MSRTTAIIKRINDKLETISGLDGVVADMLEIEEQHINAIVDLCTKQFADATIFDYKGCGSICDEDRYAVWIAEYVPVDYNDAIKHLQGYSCSKCKYGVGKQTTLYCPNCGRKMTRK